MRLFRLADKLCEQTQSICRAHCIAMAPKMYWLLVFQALVVWEVMILTTYWFERTAAQESPTLIGRLATYGDVIAAAIATAWFWRARD